MTIVQSKIQYMMRVMGCMACKKDNIYTPANLHHIRGGNGMAQKNEDRCFGLCHDHHQNGEIALHKNQADFEEEYGTEEELLIMAQSLLLKRLVAMGAKI